nr:protein phosphatase 2C domain-containing protein [Methanoculleus sp. 10]
MYAVADGLGGHARGDVASRMAIRVLEVTAGECLPGLKPAAVLEQAFQRVNAGIYAYNQENRLNAGTTLSAAIVDGSRRCWIGTVGDSRAYVITPSSVWHTRDQSYVQGLVDAGFSPPPRRCSTREEHPDPGARPLGRGMGRPRLRGDRRGGPGAQFGRAPRLCPGRCHPGDRARRRTRYGMPETDRCREGRGKHRQHHGDRRERMTGLYPGLRCRNRPLVHYDLL